MTRERKASKAAGTNSGIWANGELDDRDDFAKE
jgi:hypothetical protein